MKNCLLTICIVHYHKLPQLKKTVEFLQKNTKASFKIKILNNGYEGEGIKEYLEDLSKKSDTEVIFHPENIGCSPGRNLLIRNIDTPFIMSLDDDIYVGKNWDEPIFELFEKNKEVGAIGFSLYRTDGSFWLTGGRNLNINRSTVKQSRPHVNPEKTTEKFLEVDDVSAGAMVYRRELSNIIKWDTSYFIGFEDLEKGIRIKQSKWRCLVFIQSKFIHDKISEKKEYSEYNKSRRDYHSYRRSYIHFMEKNKYKLEPKRHFFYKYVCLLPNSILQNLVYFWLRIKK